MKLASFSHPGTTRIGVIVGDDVIDLSDAAPELPHDMLGFLEAGAAASIENPVIDEPAATAC